MTFKLIENVYEFENGMTFENWINSKYNTDKYFTNELEQKYMAENGGYLTNIRNDIRYKKKSDGDAQIYVKLTDYIVPNEEYRSLHGSGDNAGGGVGGK